MSRASSAQPKLLQVGVSFGGRFIEERLFQKHGRVSVGHGAGCTLVLPDPQLPRAVTLFELGRGRRLLRLAPGMELELSNGGEPLDFARLEALGLAERDGDSRLVRLGEQARGRIRLGEATLYFHFVQPPPRSRPEGLPASAKGSLWKRWDKGFTAALAGMLLLNFGTVQAVTLRAPRPQEELRLEELPERFSRIVLPLPRPKAAPESGKAGAATVAGAPRRARTEPTAARGSQSTAPRGARDPAEMNRRIREVGILGSLGGLDEPGAGVLDLFSEGVDPQQVAEALRGASAVREASLERLSGSERRGAEAGRAASIAELRTEGGAGERAQIGPQAFAAVHGRILDEGPEEQATTCDREVIGRYVKGQLPRVQSCFERVLKRNPTLHGKLLFRFAIDESGRVGEVEVEEDSLREGEVRACTAAAIRMWRFPIQGHGCEVMYPFVFVPSGG